jgi:hypothetical protein
MISYAAMTMWNARNLRGRNPSACRSVSWVNRSLTGIND